MIIKKYDYEVKIISINVAWVRGGIIGPKWVKVGRLLEKGESNPKTSKNAVKTYTLSLMPHKGIGFGNLCVFAVTCVDSCLNKTGQGPTPNVQRKRAARTVLFFLARDWFLDKLNRELDRIERMNDETIGVRLNMLSDVLWEAYGVIDRHPNIYFYDYSKWPDRHGWIRDNYYLTFSYDGQNLESALNVLEKGDNVAVVFYDSSPGPKCGRSAHKQPLPTQWQGYPVFDGGLTDWRIDDKPQSICGLRLLARTWADRESAISSGFAIENLDNQLVNEDSLEYWMIGGEA